MRVLTLCTTLCVSIAGCQSTAGPGGSHEQARPFDEDAFQHAVEEIVRFDPGGSIRAVRWEEDGSAFTFRRGDERLSFDLQTRTLATVEDEVSENDTPQRRRRRSPGRGRQRDRESSPDGRWVAVCRDWNVVIEPAEENEAASPIEVTTDGTRKLRYGKASWVYGEELDQNTAMWWSPDSTKLVFYEFDERAVEDFLLLEGWTDLRTGILREGYPKPGEPNPEARLLVYDLPSGAITPLQTHPQSAGSGDDAMDVAGQDDAGEQEWYIYNIGFTRDGTEILFNRTNRRQNVLEVVAIDPETGVERLVVRETQETWQKNRPEMRFLSDGIRFIWETEKSGFNHFQLRDLEGSLLVTLTRGEYADISIEHVDEEHDVLYYTAHSGRNPIDVHLHRVNLDGTDQRRLTAEGRNHRVQFSPDGRWFIDESQTLSSPPLTTLHDPDGALVATLAESDPGRIHLTGYPPAELFRFTADDGETDLYGWLYRPRNFDASRRYPLLIDVYGGPTSKGVRNRFRISHSACALGFVVAKIDNRGTRGRGKAFRGAVYQKLGIVDIADQAAGVRFLTQRPYIDGKRVGIYGHSYGGYMAALAIVKYPELFSAAVASAPVTDWRNYDTIYTERYMRTPLENPDGYDAGSCLTYADQLSGRLLLMHGMLDDNVHPNNSWQLIDALQEAGKDFEIHFYPEAGHGLGPTASRVRWEFLYRHLRP